MPDEARQREQARECMRRMWQRRRHQEEHDRERAAFYTERLLARSPDAARVLASDVPADLAEAAIDELQRRLHEDAP